jgi:hypothetical protein
MCGSVRSAIAIHDRTFDDKREPAAVVRSYVPLYNGTRMHPSAHYNAPAT